MLTFSVMIGDRVQDIFSQIQKHLFLEFNQSIPNTLSRCFNCSFSFESHSNLNCLQGSVEKKSGLWGRKQLRVLFVCLVNYPTVLDFRGWRFFLQFWKPKQNYIVELWKCCLKIGGRGFGVVRNLILCAEFNSKNFGLTYCLLNLL